MHEPDLDLPVPHLLQHVVDLERRLPQHLRQAQTLLARARRHPPRPEAVEQQPARVRSCHLEDVEVRIEVDADRAERRDRAVEQEEARRQAEVHRVDELERLADHL